jgi:hypothetical protein
VEDLGLRRVAPSGERDHYLAGAAGEGRLLTCWGVPCTLAGPVSP